MLDSTTTQRWIVAAASLLLGLASLVWVGTAWYGGSFVRAVYAGEVLPYLGRLLRIHAANNPAHQGVEFYIQLIEGAGRRLLIVTTLFWGIVLLLVRRRPSILRDYFSEDGSPLTLAVVRIVVFVLLLNALDVSSIVESARKASDVLYAPALMGWFFNHVPLDETWVRGATRLMQATCVLALIGLFTRSAAWITGLLGIYVLGIPELLGKINHGHHHLIWFSLLLGAAPSGDTLSVDALLRAWRHPDQPEHVRPSPAPRYGRPLRWAWLLVAVIYFFPGFWKFMLSGMDWMLTENLKFKMYAKWHQLQYLPALRIDQIPVLYQGLAAFTVVFEMFFGLAILFRRTRPLAVLSGFSFHLGTAYFIRIAFRTLMASYVVFVPWGTLFRRLGRWACPSVLTVRLPPSASLLRRLVAVLRSADWLQRVRYQEDASLSDSTLKAERGKTTWTGWVAFGQLLCRVPLLWPIAPLLALAFAWRSSVNGSPLVGSRLMGDTRRTVHLVGGALLGINVLFGLFLINSWPFSVYPTHAGVSGKYITDVDLSITTVAGDTLDAEQALSLSSSRRRGLMRQVLSAPDSTTQAQELRRVAQLLKKRIPASVEAEEVLVYRLKISKVPERWDDNPVERSLILTIPLSHSSSSLSRSDDAVIEPILPSQASRPIG